MKLAVVAASLLASVNSQIVHNTAKKLDARCLFENNIEKLVIDIPYPGADKANILALAAGTCDEISFLTAANDGGRKDVGVDEDMVHLVIPIDACDIRGDVYKIPTVTRSYGLIKPTANVTFGQNIAGQDIIFRYLPIAAECGTRTSYTVEFEYNDVKSADTDGCTDVDGVCVFPAYGEEATFAIKEYTSNDYAVEVDDTNRARTAGEEIFLSMQVTDLTTDLKFAVTECILKQKNDTSSDGITLLNPGEVYNSSVVGSNEPSCKISEIDLSGTYTNDFTKFNFQHILFLLDATADTNSFTLQCTIEVCNRDDASSLCNTAAAVCMNDSVDLTDSDAVAENERLMEEWMCDGLCDASLGFDCVVENNAPHCETSWKGPSPVNYTPGLGNRHYCTGCTGDIFDRTTTCDSTAPEMCTVWLHYLMTQSWNKPKDIPVVSWRLQGEKIDDNDLIKTPGLLESAGREIQLELENMQIRYLTPYFLNSPYVEYILFKNTHIQSNNPEYAKEIGDRQAVCAKQPNYEASMSLTAGSFHKESFAGFPNLDYLRWATGANVNLWELGVDYWVTAIPKLRKIEFSYMNMGKECYCQENAPATINDRTPGCGRCEAIKYCEQLCGLHPALKECNEAWNSDGGGMLTCDKTKHDSHNGTWSKGGSQGIQSVITNCGLPWNQ